MYKNIINAAHNWWHPPRLPNMQQIQNIQQSIENSINSFLNRNTNKGLARQLMVEDNWLRLNTIVVDKFIEAGFQLSSLLGTEINKQVVLAKQYFLDRV